MGIEAQWPAGFSSPCPASTPSTLPSPKPLGEHSWIWIVDDDPVITRLLARIVEGLGFSAKCYGSGQELLSAQPAIPAGCMIVDVMLPGISGITLVEQLRSRGIETPAIMTSGYATVPLCVEAMKAGAFEFLTKPFEPDRIRQAVQAGVEIDRQRQRASQSQSELQRRLAALDFEERQTLDMLLAGLPNKNIASSLDVSRRTVQYRIADLLQKMGVATRGQLLGLLVTSR